MLIGDLPDLGFALAAVPDLVELLSFEIDFCLFVGIDRTG